MPDWLASLNVDQTEEQTSEFASSKESSQHIRAIAGNHANSRAFHEVGPRSIDEFSIRTNANDAQRRHQQRGPAIATARSTGVLFYYFLHSIILHFNLLLKFMFIFKSEFVCYILSFQAK